MSAGPSRVRPLIDFILRKTRNFVPGPQSVQGTPVRWYDNGNMTERVKFKPWSEFQQKAAEAQRAIEAISSAASAGDIPSKVRSANKHLENVGSTEEALGPVFHDSLDAVAYSVPLVSASSTAVTRYEKPRLNSEKLVGVPQDIVPMKLVPDHVFCTENSPATSPILTLEAKGPLAMNTIKAQYERSLLTWLQEIFDHPVLNMKTENLHKDYYHGRMVAQALSQALHTTTGCGVLFNHNFALFMQVSGVQGGRVVVEVSDIFSCDTAPSALHGVVAILQHALAVNNKARSKAVVECVSTIGRQALAPGTGDGGISSLQPGSSRAHEEQDSEGGKGTKARGGRRTADMKGVDSESPASVHSPRPEGHWSLVPAYDYSWLSRDMYDMTTKEWTMDRMERWEDDVLIEKLVANRDRWDGLHGGCGQISTSRLGDMKVVLKWWFGYDKEYIPVMHHEMRMYCMLATKHPEVMGVVVPRLVAVGMHYWFDAVLAVEFVGERVQRVKDRVMVGSEVLGKEDVEMLLDAASHSLKVLHECGIMHGDVAARNIQAERVTDELGNKKWRVWWIDLGCATVCWRESGWKWEQEKCREMFEEEYCIFE